MNAFLNPHNGTSLPGVNDITAHYISLFREMNHHSILSTFPYLKVILVLLKVMMFRSMNWGIILLLCINLLGILMTQKLVDWKAY